MLDFLLDILGFIGDIIVHGKIAVIVFAVLVVVGLLILAFAN